MNRYASSHILIGTFLVILISCIVVAPARGEQQDETLSVLGGPETEASVTGRYSRLVSRTPENVTIVTATEIEGLNAHTLLDILAVVPGIQLESQTGPAGLAYVHLQGSSFSHVLVLLDGIPINNLADNFPELGSIPAQIVERVEVVKGAASSSWGQALGGVINIITKSPDPEKKGGGAASVSQGERGTSDAHAELSGTLERFGYYLAGGYFGSGGLRPNTDVKANNAYSKLTYELPGRGQALFSLYYANQRRGELAVPSLDFQGKDAQQRLILALSLSKPLSNQIDLELSARDSYNRPEIYASTISSGTQLKSVRDLERFAGGSAKVLWHASDNVMALGVDYDHVTLRQNDALHQVDLLNRDADRWGFYLNDTYTRGRWSLSPGARYDITGSNGNQFSPSFGATWQADENTTIRAYLAKGYSLPSFNLTSGAEKVWTTQLGAETGDLPYLWLKGTLFRNDTWDITVSDPQSGRRQIKKGVEVEARTTPYFNTALSTGYTFVDAKSSSDNSVVQGVPRHTALLGLRYDDGSFLRAVINGRLVDWNSPASDNASYGGFLWDLFLTVTPFGRRDGKPELFFSLHNAFNGSQYVSDYYPNPGRWAEAGVRCRF
jgi:vitamin B12 transporter